MAAGVPLALGVAALSPALWLAATAWVVLCFGLIVADAALAPRPRKVSLSVQAPRTLGVGRAAEAVVSATFDGRGPGAVEFALDGDARLSVSPGRARAAVASGRGDATFALNPVRRGRGGLTSIWARWTGPLGLVWRQRQDAPSAELAIIPDIVGVKEQALKLFSRDAPVGMKALRESGEGADFHALKEFQVGMDLRDIDWKQSARHLKLVAREYRAERNHHIVLALDTGRLMSAPLDGSSRMDRAINAALLLAFVSLKMGDRVGLFAFDARPRIASGLVTGSGAFPLLQKLASEIDYSTEETNFTLGLTALSGQLDRRALVVVFTDFVDATSAELMTENVARLLRTHLVLFVTFRDDELEKLTKDIPETADGVARAVVADRLLKQRETVSTRLKRMGVEVVEAAPGDLSGALLDGYIDIKRRGLL